MSITTRTSHVVGTDMTGYMVKDTQRALRFYRDVLGLEPTTLYPDDKGAEYELPDGTTFGLWNGSDEMPFQSGNGVLFAVADFEAAVADAKARGGAFLMVEEQPTCHMAMLEDSEGNYVVLHKRKT